MPEQTVETKDGFKKRVVADNDADLKDAVSAAKGDSAPVYPNINVPVQKGHDLVATGADASRVLVNGEGAHNSPENAIGDDGKENGDPDVRASGLDEAPYKSVPQYNNGGEEPRTASDSEVRAAKKDAVPANEEDAVRTANKSSK